DARVRGWFLLDSYLPTFCLTGAYLLCIWLGKKFMKDRPPFSLRAHLIVYNLGITLLSLYMLIELTLATWEGGYNLQCQNLHSAGEADIRVRHSSSSAPSIRAVLPSTSSVQHFCVHRKYLLSLFSSWYIKCFPYSIFIGFFGPTLNSFIHVLMYSYYGLSVIPSMRKYLWWKKYLTQAQLIQFLLTIAHTLSAAVKPCGFPFGCLMFQSSYMATLVVLFINFYIKTYRKAPSRTAIEETPVTTEIKNGFHKD
ncbi:ELOV2 protein, partial [Fregetta grallaria]|nr:ELOV2 protein [Fregetta grallaria]